LLHPSVLQPAGAFDGRRGLVHPFPLVFSKSLAERKRFTDDGGIFGGIPLDLRGCRRRHVFYGRGRLVKKRLCESDMD